MEKVSGFIVKYRYIILAIMIAVTIVFALFIPNVNINEDYTKYLADSSNMKQGIDIMDSEFPDLASSNTIRIMFTGLDESEKEEIKQDLENLPYVDSVSFEKDNSDYNRDNYTLYEITTEYDFDSPEEESIRNSICEKYSDYKINIEQQSNTRTKVPSYIYIIAAIIILIILFTMSGSWIEPLIFIIVIGLAIVLNMGTNILKDSVSQTTFSISAILQLVLSMDYSIILMNRFRQERQLSATAPEAMTKALANAFSSVTSSAVTTIVGLLMLVFMSFKIGPDFGIVLAKGVLCSLICVFTVLPALIIIFDSLIFKTKKPVPRIPLGGLATGEYKARFILTPVFVLLFIVALILQNNTGISFAMSGSSEINKIFPQTNTTVVLYNNNDSENMQIIADELESDENVKAVISYDTFFDRQQTAGEMYDTIEELGADVNIDSSTLKLMFYKFHYGNNLPAVKIADLLNFIADDVVTDELFADKIDDEIKTNIDKISIFSDKKILQSKMSMNELAVFFDMSQKDVENMFVLYYKTRSGGNIEKMTINQFVSFLSDEIINDPDYASFISSDMKNQINIFKILADKNNITTPLSYTDAAAMLGMDPQQMKLLYVYYYSQLSDYNPGTMTLNGFVTFINNEVISNPAFSSFFDEDAKSKLKTLSMYTDTAAITTQMNAETMAQFMGMTTEEVNSVYNMYYGEPLADSTKMTLDGFLSYILSDSSFTSKMSPEQISRLNQMLILIQTAKSGIQLNASQLAAILQTDETTASQLIYLYGMSKGDPSLQSAGLFEITQFLATQVITDPAYSWLFTEEQKAHITQLYQLLAAAVSGTEFSYTEMSSVTGIDANYTKQAYTMYAGSCISDKTMCPYDFVSYILSTPAIYSEMDESQLSQL